MKKEKKKEPMIQFQIRLPRDLKEQLDQTAEEEGHTPTSLVRWLIKEYVNS